MRRTNEMPVLVTGARGNVGAGVVRGLLAAGQPVRAVSRSITSSDVPDGVDAVQADLTRPDTLRDALRDVQRVFLYAEAEGAHELVAALVAAGVEQVALLSSASVLFPDAASNPIAQQHLALEHEVQRAGLRWTFVQPAYFATNALRWTSIRTDRELRTAYPEARTPMVHERDIADLAVAALISDAWDGRGLPALGAEPLTVREQVAAIADAIGSEVRVKQVTEEEYRRELAGSLPPAMVERLIGVRGAAPLPPAEVAVDAVQEVLDRPPTSFQEWAREHANDFR